MALVPGRVHARVDVDVVMVMVALARPTTIALRHMGRAGVVMAATTSTTIGTAAGVTIVRRSCERRQ